MNPKSPIAIVLEQHRDYAVATVFAYGVLETSARGRNEECALADAVARFRTTRTLRHSA